jgi:hypothetical protein
MIVMGERVEHYGNGKIKRLERDDGTVIEYHSAAEAPDDGDPADVADLAGGEDPNRIAVAYRSTDGTRHATVEMDEDETVRISAALATTGLHYAYIERWLD